MKFLGIIPARYASTRFPAKPLALLGGKTVIQRVYEQVAGVLDDAYVATDDERIEAAVKAFGGNVVGQYNTYIERIDDVVDALCNEITRLENENMQLSWDVLHIGSLINSLVNEIRTLCN